MENMLQSMMKRFPLFVIMGVMIVMIALIISAVNAANTASYYAVDKGTRETANEWVQVRAGIESTIVWLPYFKFLGVAMILGGITMALGVISLRLQDLGKQVMASVPDHARVPIPPKPVTVYLMRMFMMLGMLVIIIGFIVSLGVAGTASEVFSKPAPVIDAAGAGDSLLTSLASVFAAEAWLEAFKFVGVAFLFLGLGIMLGAITMALGLIATTLRNLGNDVMSLWPADLNPGTPDKPVQAKMFPMIMMMGWLVLIIGFIWALVLSGTVSSYWNHSIATELNPAEVGSVLLNQLGLIEAQLPYGSLAYRKI